jgi:hypothetical protein
MFVCSAGAWSDNGFNVLPGEVVQLTFTAASGVVLSSIEQVQTSLRITSLTDTFPTEHWEKKRDADTSSIDV